MELLEKVRATLQAFPAVRLAAAFGSVARGSEHARSDVDLALLLDPDTPGDRAAARRLMLEFGLTLEDRNELGAPL